MRFVISVNPDVTAGVEPEEIDRPVAKDLICHMAITTLGVLHTSTTPDYEPRQPTASSVEIRAG